MLRSLYNWATKEEPDAIVTAAKKHDTNKVRQLLRRGIDVNTREKDKWDSRPNESGFTALARACEREESISISTVSIPTVSIPTAQKIQCITALLEAKADPNCRSRFDTPLVTSAYQGNTAQIQLLLEHKADVNLANRDDRRTALHAAAIGNDERDERGPECMQLLLESKADPQAKDREGYTPLRLAKDCNRLKAAEVLTDFLKQAETEKVENQAVVPTMSPRSR